MVSQKEMYFPQSGSSVEWGAVSQEAFLALEIKQDGASWLVATSPAIWCHLLPTDFLGTQKDVDSVLQPQAKKWSQTTPTRGSVPIAPKDATCVEHGKGTCGFEPNGSRGTRGEVFGLVSRR